MTIMKDVFKIIAFFAILTAVMCGAYHLEAAIDADTWNEGVCLCGGEYEFSNASHRKNGGVYYYYTCNECGRIIETNTQQTKNHKTYEVAAIVEEDGTLVDWHGEAWTYDNDLEEGQLVIVVFNDMGTENIYDDEIIEIRG